MIKLMKTLQINNFIGIIGAVVFIIFNLLRGLPSPFLSLHFCFLSCITLGISFFVSNYLQQKKIENEVINNQKQSFLFLITSLFLNLISPSICFGYFYELEISKARYLTLFTFMFADFVRISIALPILLYKKWNLKYLFIILISTILIISVFASKAFSQLLDSEIIAGFEWIALIELMLLSLICNFGLTIYFNKSK